MHAQNTAVVRPKGGPPSRRTGAEIMFRTLAALFGRTRESAPRNVRLLALECLEIRELLTTTSVLGGHPNVPSQTPSPAPTQPAQVATSDADVDVDVDVDDGKRDDAVTPVDQTTSLDDQ